MTSRSIGIGERFAAGEEQAGHDQPTGSSLPYGLLLVFVLLIFATPALLLPQLDAVRPTEIVGFVAVAAMIVDRLLSKRSLTLPWPQGYALLGFVVVALLSGFGALWVRLALDSSIDLARFVVIYFVIVNTVDRRSRLEGLVATIALGSAIPALGAFLTNFEPGERLSWMGIFENPNDFAFAMVLAVPLAASLAGRRSWLWRAAGWTLAPLFVATILATNSRGALLGLVAALAVLALRSRRTSFRVLFAVGLVAIVVFVGGFWDREQGFTDLTHDVTVMQRLQTIQAGLAMWADRPILGVGLGCSAIGWPLYAPPGSWSPSWLHNHNTFVQVLSETGTLGFLLFGAALLITLAYLRQVRRAALALDDRPLLTVSSGIESATWGLIVCGLSGGYLLTWFPYLLFGLAAAARSLPAVRAQVARTRRQPPRGALDRAAAPPPPEDRRRANPLPAGASFGAPSGRPA